MINIILTWLSIFIQRRSIVFQKTLSHSTSVSTHGEVKSQKFSFFLVCQLFEPTGRRHLCTVPNSFKLENTRIMVRVICFDCSSRFETIYPALPGRKLEEAGDHHPAAWTIDSLSSKQQHVRSYNNLSDTVCSKKTMFFSHHIHPPHI